MQATTQQLATAQTLSDWDLIVATLGLHRGDLHDCLDDNEAYLVYCQGDGYGQCSPAELAEINDGWDWSHIRDSSERAVKCMAATIRGLLGI